MKWFFRFAERSILSIISSRIAPRSVSLQQSNKSEQCSQGASTRYEFIVWLKQKMYKFSTAEFHPTMKNHTRRRTICRPSMMNLDLTPRSTAIEYGEYFWPKASRMKNVWKSNESRFVLWTKLRFTRKVGRDEIEIKSKSLKTRFLWAYLQAFLF